MILADSQQSTFTHPWSNRRVMSPEQGLQPGVKMYAAVLIRSWLRTLKHYSAQNTPSVLVQQSSISCKNHNWVKRYTTNKGCASVADKNKYILLASGVLGTSLLALGYMSWRSHKKSLIQTENVTKSDYFSRLTTVSAESGINTPLSKRFNFIADVVEKTSPAVVYVEIKERHPFYNRRLATSNGSGFVVREDGLILTNAHVVGSKSSVSVRFQDGRELEGFVMAVDPVSDLAAVQVNAAKLPVLTLGKSSELRAGEWVIAMGSPLALSNTVTCGIVSSVHRRSQELGIHHKDMDFIQTDAVINFGNSGGPLVNLDGLVIGINTMKVTPGISFAIPSDRATEFLNKVNDLRKKGVPTARKWFGPDVNAKRKHYIGITMLTLTQDLLEELRNRVPEFPDIASGVFIHKIIISSPAHRSGLHAGDIIVEINGKNVQSSTDIYQAISEGGTLQVTVYRGRKRMEFQVLPEEIT